MRKAFLVPAEMTQSVKPMDRTLEGLDSEMMSIIENPDIPMDVKVLKYNQILQRYKFLQTERNKPYKIDIEEISHNTALNSIMKGMPETKIPLAKLLTDFIMKQGNIQVEENGEISVNGSRIYNSNIIDLVHDLIRDRKNNPPPVGIETLAKALKLSNVPLEYIGNKNRYPLFLVPETPKRSLVRQILDWSE